MLCIRDYQPNVDVSEHLKFFGLALMYAHSWNLANLIVIRYVLLYFDFMQLMLHVVAAIEILMNKRV